MIRRAVAALAIFLACPVAGNLSAQDAHREVIILDTLGFWRCYYVLKPPVVRKDGAIKKVNLRTKWLNRESQPPPKDWRKVDFDDSSWHRGAGVFQKRARRAVGPNSPAVALACRRAKFTVTDPGRVGDLELSIGYRGGVVIYLNGTEIARGHMPKGKITLDTLAEDYPPECHLRADGSPLIWKKWSPTKETLRRLALRVRKLTGVRVPKRLLRKGTNVIAIELHRTVHHPKAVTVGRRGRRVAIRWGTCGLVSLRMSASSSAGIAANVARPKGPQVWNSDVLTSDFDQDYGDRAERLRPIEIVGTRGGTFSGKVVVGSDRPIEGLHAVMGPLARKGGGLIAPAAVRVRYALPWGYEHGSGGRYPFSVGRFDALSEEPPKVVEVRVKKPRGRRQRNPKLIVPKPVFGAICPVWVTVTVPRTARPGSYEGTLTIVASGRTLARVPVRLKVCAWKLPPPKEYRTFVEFIQSPDTLSLAFKTPLWSEEHWRLIDRSLSLLGELGNKTCYVPLIVETNLGNAESMVRWVRKPGGGYDYDFSVMERYLDLVERRQGKPVVVCVVVWDVFLEGGRYTGQARYMPKSVQKDRVAHGNRGPSVTVLDRVTGKTSKLALPKQSDVRSRALWKPLLAQLRVRLKRRGLERAMTFGFTTDTRPTKQVTMLYKGLQPDVRWMCQAHSPRRDLHGVPITYQAFVWPSRFARDSQSERGHGWKRPDLMVQFPRSGMDGFPMVTQRFMAEVNIAGHQRGFGRLGGDTWHVVKDARGRRTARVTEGRFPKSSWRALNIVTAYLAPGPEGPVATTRLEVIREGIEECEARIFIDRALTDKKLRAKIGQKRATRYQKILDERIVTMLRGMSAFAFHEHFTGNAADGHVWWHRPGELGAHWFVSSRWQERSEKLFTAAAQIAGIIDSN